MSSTSTSTESEPSSPSNVRRGAYYTLRVETSLKDEQLEKLNKRVRRALELHCGEEAVGLEPHGIYEGSPKLMLTLIGDPRVQ